MYSEKRNKRDTVLEDAAKSNAKTASSYMIATVQNRSSYSVKQAELNHKHEFIAQSFAYEVSNGMASEARGAGRTLEVEGTGSFGFVLRIPQLPVSAYIDRQPHQMPAQSFFELLCQLKLPRTQHKRFRCPPLRAETDKTNHDHRQCCPPALSCLRLFTTMSAVDTSWMPATGRHQVSIGASLGKALKARKGIAKTSASRVPIRERDFYSLKCMCSEQCNAMTNLTRARRQLQATFSRYDANGDDGRGTSEGIHECLGRASNLSGP